MAPVFPSYALSGPMVFMPPGAWSDDRLINGFLNYVGSKAAEAGRRGDASYGASLRDLEVRLRREVEAQRGAGLKKPRPADLLPLLFKARRDRAGGVDWLDVGQRSRNLPARYLRGTGGLRSDGTTAHLLKERARTPLDPPEHTNRFTGFRCTTAYSHPVLDSTGGPRSLFRAADSQSALHHLRQALGRVGPDGRLLPGTAVRGADPGQTEMLSTSEAVGPEKLLNRGTVLRRSRFLYDSGRLHLEASLQRRDKGFGGYGPAPAHPTTGGRRAPEQDVVGVLVRMYSHRILRMNLCGKVQRSSEAERKLDAVGPCTHLSSHSKGARICVPLFHGFYRATPVASSVTTSWARMPS